MKTLKPLLLSLIFLGSALSGCKQPMEAISETANSSVQTTPENPVQNDLTEAAEESTENTDLSKEQIHEQLELIASKKDFWYPEDEFMMDAYMYAVTDLDQNGQLELITSLLAGTGLFTTSSFFEVNSEWNDLLLCPTNFIEGDSQPDIMLDHIPVYFDPSDQTYHYIVTDTIRNGAAESYHSTQSLILKDGKIQADVLGRSSTIYSDGGSKVVCSYEDSNGQEITEEDYTSIASHHFSDLEAMDASFLWQKLSDLNALSQEELIGQLEMSYQNFSLNN